MYSSCGFEVFLFCEKALSHWVHEMAFLHYVSAYGFVIDYKKPLHIAYIYGAYPSLHPYVV